jgi:hypothetical protein
MIGQIPAPGYSRRPPPRETVHDCLARRREPSLRAPSVGKRKAARPGADRERLKTSASKGHRESHHMPRRSEPQIFLCGAARSLLAPHPRNPLSAARRSRT